MRMTKKQAEKARDMTGSDRLNCKLRQFRQQRGLSQRDVALFTGVNRQTIHATETGENVTVLSGLLIARFLGVKLDDLWPAAAPFVDGKDVCETAKGEREDESNN